MELYIGGYAQNKLEYVKSLYPDLLSSADYILVNDFHLIVKKQLDQGLDESAVLEKMDELIKDADQKKTKLIIICDEIGSGIVPMEKADRLWREVVGRLLCMIAKKADMVTRIVCGLPQVIKS